MVSAKSIIVTILSITMLAAPVFAAGTYEDDTYTQWGVSDPFISATNFGLQRTSTTLHDAGSETFTDIRERSGDDIGAYNHVWGGYHVDDTFIKAYVP